MILITVYTGQIQSDSSSEGTFNWNADVTENFGVTPAAVIAWDMLLDLTCRDIERTDNWSALLRLSILADLTSLLINNREEG